jgi:tRNA(fMet)-specific endonuclease VapC
MKYLLDTCLISDFARGVRPVLSRLQATPPSAIAISVVTAMEVEYGLLLRPGLARKLRHVLDGLFGSCSVVPFDRADAAEAARLRAELRGKGLPVGAYDLLIAATALRRGLVLVTSNTAEFGHCESLMLEDWRVAGPA